jgi:signal transduction histidine kinase
MVGAVAMTIGRFRFSTEILKRLGEELNPNLDQGILELVKNAHDADAKCCEVSLQGIDEIGGTIRITDDGVGMTVKEIEDRFLLLGRSSKVSSSRTPGGRIPAGSKGLGRLAALRAGSEVTLVTRPKREPLLEHRLRIRWDAFDSVAAVDDVALSITTKPRPKGSKQGTTIEVVSLTRKVSRPEVKRLARSLLLLGDPFGEDSVGFRPILTSSEFKDLEELVDAKYFDAAEFHLQVSVGANGVASAKVLDWRGKALYKGNHHDLRRSDTRYECPAATFDFWVFILDGKTFQTRSSSLADVRGWLQEFGGVFLYVDGLRVSPYGDAGNDWLDINLRRNQSPEFRPSTNTSIGRIRVDESGGQLVAKTDRSGLIDSAVFASLGSMARDGLEWMARKRLETAEVRRRAERKDTPKKASSARDAVEKEIAKTGTGSKALKAAFQQYDKSREAEVKALRLEVQLYRTLSTAGITAATFAHEASGGPIKIIVRAAATLRRRIKKIVDPIPQDLIEVIDAIQSSADSLGAFSDTTLVLVDRDKRRIERVAVNDVISGVVDSYSPFFEAREVTVEFSPGPGSPYLQGSIAAVESILINLLTNSLTALSSSKVKLRKVLVASTSDTGSVQIVVADNGDGLKDFAASEIWLPGVTSRPGGSGLGLTIVRDTTLDLGGECSVVENGRLGGAEFVVSLPILGR